MTLSSTAVVRPVPAGRAGGRRRVRLGILIALVAAVVLAASYTAVCAYMALVLTRPTRELFTRDPTQFGLSYESVSFPSRLDGTRLDGWLLIPDTNDQQPVKRPLVVVHGKGADRQAGPGGGILEVAAIMVRQGHPALTFDLRGSGWSGGERFTLGAQEVGDVGGAVDFLAQRGMTSDGVDLLGFSMGAATSLLFARDEPSVRAVVEDSGYADLGDLLNTQVPKASGLPGFFTPGMVLLARPLIGLDAYSIRPIDGMPTLAKRGIKVMVIHGEADALIPVSHGRRLAAAYGPDVETLFVPGADHVRSYITDPTTYAARLTSFFARAVSAR